MDVKKLLTKDQIALVENSWDFVLLNTQEAGDTFYNYLFEIDPSLRSLFKNDLKIQAQKLVAMITFIVIRLYDLENLTSEIKALGKRHQGVYHVRPEHYQSVGNALLNTLKESLASQWDDDLRMAWKDVYVLLANIMIEAGKEKIGDQGKSIA